ncbi:MAG: hypothetical protein IJJ65_07635 [Butyrivibrio sp.]|nr:hypothetical protein [Butyrivibrio sp.]
MKTYEFKPICPKENIIQGASFRISVLTESLLRLEYEENGHFTDNATQVVLNRDFPQVDVDIICDEEDKLLFRTKRLEVCYDKRAFSPKGLKIKLLDNGIVWNYGENGWNLFGTVRTLDETNGVVLYEKGLFSREGYAWFDDGESCELSGEEIFDRQNPKKIFIFGDMERDLKKL